MLALSKSWTYDWSRCGVGWQRSVVWRHTRRTIPEKATFTISNQQKMINFFIFPKPSPKMNHSEYCSPQPKQKQKWAATILGRTIADRKTATRQTSYKQRSLATQISVLREWCIAKTTAQSHKNSFCFAFSCRKFLIAIHSLPERWCFPVFRHVFYFKNASFIGRN